MPCTRWAPTARWDAVWPPAGIETFDPWHLPLINTLILLCSGCAATWAHHALVHENNRKDMKWGLIIAIALGAIFTVFQAYEYSHAAFGFGAISTGPTSSWRPGFHGAHVVIGTIFLFVCLIRVHEGAFHARAACRLRGGGVVLALRRCGLAVPVRRGLRLGRVTIFRVA